MKKKRGPPKTQTPEDKRRYHREWNRDYRAANPEKSAAYQRMAWMRNKYGLTEESFEALLQAQDHSCAICHIPFILSNRQGRRDREALPFVDHDHQTNKVRGLLCQQCNSLLGHARDSIAILAYASGYLKRNDCGNTRPGWSGVVQGKVWGETRAMIETPMLALHKISVLPNAQCSLHVHNKKCNTFVVLEGALLVDIHRNDYALVDTTTLRSGGTLTVSPGEYHRFRTGPDEGAEALEIYHLDPLSSDIVRKDCGALIGAAAGPDVWKTIREAEAAQK